MFFHQSLQCIVDHRVDHLMAKLLAFVRLTQGSVSLSDLRVLFHSCLGNRMSLFLERCMKSNDNSLDTTLRKIDCTCHEIFENQKISNC